MSTTSLTHLVLWRWRDGASEEDIDRALDEFCSMAPDVGGAISFRRAANRAGDRPTGHGYTHCSIFEFTDAAAFVQWQDFPGHVEWSRRYVRPDDPLVDSFLSLDVSGPLLDAELVGA